MVGMYNARYVNYNERVACEFNHIGTSYSQMIEASVRFDPDHRLGGNL